jgi:hypothetical protein
VEPTEPTTGSISPELVLVDPDLAAGARAALPDHPWPAPLRIEPRESTRRRQEPTRHRRIPIAATFSILSFAALVGILGLSLLPTRDQPTFAAEGRSQPTAPSPPRGVSTQRTAPSSTPGASSQPTAPSPSTGARPQPAAQGKKTAAPQRKNPRPKRTKKTSGQRRSPATPPVPSGRRKLPQFEPARTFAWVPQARAAYYQLALFRNGRSVYQTRTRAPRLTLPRRVRFTPGQYRWTVRPAIRDQNRMRLADPIVDSTFRVGRD